MRLIDQLIECEERLQAIREEYVKMLRKVNENWKPGAWEATKFEKEQARIYVDHLEEESVHDHLYIRAYKDYYIIMKIIQGGPIHYYSEDNK